jgi:hypothetical protein
VTLSLLPELVNCESAQVYLIKGQGVNVDRAVEGLLYSKTVLENKYIGTYCKTNETAVEPQFKKEYEC